MKTFKSPDDLQKLSPDHPAHATVKELIEQLIEAYTWEDHPYNAEDYGYILLVEEGDADRTLDELWDGCTLLNIMWEGIMLRDDSAMNVSGGLFEEFVRPYDQRLLDEFGGGAIHFCGRGDHYIGRMSRMQGLRAVQQRRPCDSRPRRSQWHRSADEG